MPDGRETRSTDEQDAYSGVRRLKRTAEGGIPNRYLHPPLTETEREVAAVEGWILRVA